MEEVVGLSKQTTRDFRKPEEGEEEAKCLTLQLSQSKVIGVCLFASVWTDSIG